MRGDKLWSRTALFAAYAALYGFLQKRRKEQRRTLDLTVSENNTAQQWAKYYKQLERIPAGYNATAVEKSNCAGL